MQTRCLWTLHLVSQTVTVKVKLKEAELKTQLTVTQPPRNWKSNSSDVNMHHSIKFRSLSPPLTYVVFGTRCPLMDFNATKKVEHSRALSGFCRFGEQKKEQLQKQKKNEINFWLDNSSCSALIIPAEGLCRFLTNECNNLRGLIASARRKGFCVKVILSF